MRIRLDIPLMPWEIAKFTAGICDLKSISKKITHITIDSRIAEPGDLFVPIKGEHFNGEDFTRDAILKGALVISRNASKHGITVKNTDTALLDIAEGYKSKLKNLKNTVAVTGSVGKSTTKEFLKVILSKKYKTHASYGNYNNTVGAPITVLKAPADTEMLVVEAGMNHSGELSLISKCIRPDIAIITNIGQAHIGNFGSRECIAKAKREIIYDGVTQAVLVPYSEELLNDISVKRSVSCKDSSANICILAQRQDPNGSDASVLINGVPHFSFRTSLPGAHILECLSFAVGACTYIGMDRELIKSGIESLSHDTLRQKYIHFKDFSIYDDSYNSSPEALLSALELLSLDKGIEKSALIGDMLELGHETERLHFEAGVNAVKYGMKRLYLFGVYSPFVMQGALSSGMSRKDIFINTDTADPKKTAKQILQNRAKGEIILLKASNALNLKRICEYIKLLEG